MKTLTALVASFLLLTVSAFAGDKESKASASISHDQLKAALAAGHVVVLDVNGTATYREGHIPGAIDFEANEGKLASVLPAEKSTLIVAYCGNERCTAYKQGVKAAQELGYTNVTHYSGGIAGWKQAGEKVARAN